MMMASAGQQQMPQMPLEALKGMPPPDETSKQILNACTPDQLKELSKLTPGALQNLQAIVSQFMATQKDPVPASPTQQQQQQQGSLHMGGRQQNQHQQQQQNRQPGGGGLPESHLLRAQQHGNGGAALASGQLSTENPPSNLRNMGMAEDLPIMSLPAMPPGMMPCGPGKTGMTPRSARRPLADMNLGSFDLESPRFSSLMDFSGMDNFTFGAAPMEIEKQKEEEIVISPRSARMLLNAIQEGSGYPTAAAMTASGPPVVPHGNGRHVAAAVAAAASNARQNQQQQQQQQQNHQQQQPQQQTSANGANNSSCSAATAEAEASPMQCDGPRQSTPPQTPRAPSEVLSLQPFDSLVRNEDDEKYLDIFNSWMSNNAMDSGRPFATLLPFTPKKAQQGQQDNLLAA